MVMQTPRQRKRQRRRRGCRGGAAHKRGCCSLMSGVPHCGGGGGDGDGDRTAGAMTGTVGGSTLITASIVSCRQGSAAVRATRFACAIAPTVSSNEFCQGLT